MDSTPLSSISKKLAAGGSDAHRLVDTTVEASSLLSVEDIQKYLNRSRASVYRYANTDSKSLNPPCRPKRPNREVRQASDRPLKFRPPELQRFAKQVLGLNPTIQVHTPQDTVTQSLMREILQELKAIHHLLRAQQSGPEE